MFLSAISRDLSDDGKVVAGTLPPFLFLSAISRDLSDDMWAAVFAALLAWVSIRYFAGPV